MSTTPRFRPGETVTRPGDGETFRILDIDPSDNYATLLRVSDFATRGSWLLDDDGWTHAGGREPAEEPGTVATYVAEDDGAFGVQIDTRVGTGQCRVWLNDGLIFEGDPEVD
ncbi:MAG: hypothetical protein L0H93_02515 [Nocardioides sp.]|nr:hypothetical protein [Nocardioides sp.]